MATKKALRPGESITYSSGRTTGAPDLRLLHYNDVYHIEAGSAEPVGGIARFKALCQYYQRDDAFAGQPGVLTLFSGDAFNPSLESSVTKGKHMLGPLNNVGTDVACLGNHDLDFGVEQFAYLASQCKFPWLCANVLDPALGEEVPLGNCKRTTILTASNGIKVGVIGLVEREWLDTINTLPPNLQYLSASATAAELAPKLRAEGAEIVVCLTHQRQPNDEKLAKSLTPGTVDLILGGHDHYYAHGIINGTHVLRSGTDFKQLSYMECRRKQQGGGWDIDIVRRDVVSSIAEEPYAAQMVDKMTASLKPKLEKPIGYTATPLDARFTTVRLKESNLGNFVCDLMRFHYNADCCIMAAGTIRGDQIYPPGVLRVKDIMNCFPFEDPCVVVALTGKAILEALENAVSKYPALEGRFPQVSNIGFTFDASLEANQRCSNVTIGAEPLDLSREYTLVTRDYMVRGKDGFTSLTLEEEGGRARSVVDEESGLLISMILRQYFMSLKVLGLWKNWSQHMGEHWSRVHDNLHEVHPVKHPKQVGVVKDSALPAADRSGARDNVEELQPSLVGKAEQLLRDDSTGASSRQKHDHQVHDEAYLDHSDSEDEHAHVPPTISDNGRERELHLMRKVMRKWRQVTGLPGHPSMAEQSDEFDDDFGVHWTRAICPRIENRIRIVNAAA